MRAGTGDTCIVGLPGTGDTCIVGLRTLPGVEVGRARQGSRPSQMWSRCGPVLSRPFLLNRGIVVPPTTASGRPSRYSSMLKDSMASWGKSRYCQMVGEGGHTSVQLFLREIEG